ncbi:MAG: hypothetical protein LBC79_08695 [Deltaproteobacteria bacterium]|jgi:hypothetical protein|nr:hypothetical protein [Deltaproteobacteria bacterium]
MNEIIAKMGRIAAFLAYLILYAAFLYVAHAILRPVSTSGFMNLPAPTVVFAPAYLLFFIFAAGALMRRLPAMLEQAACLFSLLGGLTMFVVGYCAFPPMMDGVYYMNRFQDNAGQLVPASPVNFLLVFAGCIWFACRLSAARGAFQSGRDKSAGVCGFMVAVLLLCCGMYHVMESITIMIVLLILTAACFTATKERRSMPFFIFGGYALFLAVLKIGEHLAWVLLPGNWSFLNLYPASPAGLIAFLTFTAIGFALALKRRAMPPFVLLFGGFCLAFALFRNPLRLHYVLENLSHFTVLLYPFLRI